EYTALRAEATARSGYQHQLIQVHVTAVSLLLGAMFTTGQGAWAALVLPVESSLFGLWWLDHGMTIQQLSAYIRLWTEGRVAQDTGARRLLSWESNYAKGITTLSGIRTRLFRALVFATFGLPAWCGVALTC